jgi:two-component system, LytTR family, sensor kinase
MLLKPQKRSPLVSHQMAFLTIIGFWIFHALIVSLRAAVMDFPNQDDLSLKRMIVTLVGVFLTWLLYLFLRTFDRRAMIWRVVAAFLASIPVAIIFAWANFYIFNVYDTIGLFEENPPSNADDLQMASTTALQQIAEIAIPRYFFLIAWAAVYLAMGNAREVQEAERVTSRYAQAAQDAELRSLRYQVNPHFLFNTLNSLSSLVITNKNDRAEAMIQNLSSFYRSSLSIDPLEDVTLSEEVELQKLYLDIEIVRFPERLRTVIDIEPALADFHVPALLLQPLVENAIKYGVSQSIHPVTISIKARRQQGSVIIIIEDDGDPLSGIQERHSSGIGLPNVRDRLEARFGKRARLETITKPSGGFIAAITIDQESHKI